MGCIKSNTYLSRYKYVRKKTTCISFHHSLTLVLWLAFLCANILVKIEINMATAPESRMSFILLTSSRPLYPLYLPATPCSRHVWENVSFLKFSKHMEQITNTKSVFQFCPWTWCMCWMTVWCLFFIVCLF